jgi:two-component system chemotaxis response regulator CheY
LEAGDGVAGLSVLDTETVDLIFSDVNMPNMNGLDFVSEIRKRGAATPIVMVTTEGGQDSIADALARGANGYVVKPFTPEKLGEVLSSVLK